MNHLGIDVGKRKCRAAIKNDKENTLDKFFFLRKNKNLQTSISGYSIT